MSAEPTKISAGGVKKGRNVGQKVVTANALLDGDVVYLGADHKWTRSIDGAVVKEADDALELLAIATADEKNVVGPYLMDVELKAGRILPTGRAELRETIRDLGPTIHPEFGRKGVHNVSI